ncbi:MAG: 4a-hydroxytetrahydrobiopterin dehydratase [Motiliproteus sp.]|nr:4a-hydroxytetrahydrobiopterin dehydratase [Motiliproteus sp.]MCW9053961.1 4a-hydroxytetrahydrobiopterin dehydratase [Motiliproteus sp.]
MSELSNQACEACRADAPRVEEPQRSELMKSIPQWQLSEMETIPQLQRVFTFKNFRQALAFTNQVGEMAEQQGHHPALTTEWGKVTVSWWTHKIRGLHQNDFICAAKTDEIAGS